VERKPGPHLARIGPAPDAAALELPLTSAASGDSSHEFGELKRRFEVVLANGSQKAEFVAYCKPYLCEVRSALSAYSMLAQL
jgi:hypothetical protein